MPQEPQHSPGPRGRAAASNPANRFERLAYEPDVESLTGSPAQQATEYFRDLTRSVISRNESPDVGFNASINPYRGCEHGCIYCYARPTHEYLGLSAGLDFETKIFVKVDAPELLRKELSSRKWKPEPLGFSGVTDPYQPIERKLRLTRRCMQVLADFRQPVVVITKNEMVTRDIDHLQHLAQVDAALVIVSVTTLDEELSRVMEPRTSMPERRLRAIATLTAAGIRTGVLVAPIIPGLTDHETPAILEAAANAGAMQAGYTVIRLPLGVKEIFADWLEQRLPQHKDKVLNRIRAVRSGKLNEAQFGSRMRGSGVFADHIASMFKIQTRKLGLAGRRIHLNAEAFRRPRSDGQLSLFEE